MKKEEKLEKIQGLQTADTVAETLDIKRQSAINLLSKLKKEGHVTTSGGGPQKRIYKVTKRKQRPRDRGMYDLINKYSPMKINPPYDHQVHGPYSEEQALVDAIKTRSFRTILASLRLYNHITNWKKLYHYAREKGVWQEVGALHEVARQHFPVRKMPEKYKKKKGRKWKQITELKERNNYPTIEKEWKTHIPFNEKDLEAVA